MIDPKASDALWKLFRKGHAMLTKEEQKCYELWLLWKRGNPKHKEIADWILGSINRDEAREVVVKMEEMFMQTEKEKRIKMQARPMTLRRNRMPYDSQT